MTVPFVGTLEPSYVGIDWISATATEFYARRDLQRAAEYAVDTEVAAGNDRKVWRWRDYEGWSAGQARWGERADSLYVQLSGASSFVSWLTLLGVGVNVTRLDVQVTLSNCPAWCDLAEQAFRELENDPVRAAQAGTYSWYVTRPSGSTLYVGSPASELRLRLYDKAAESKGVYPAGSWRYEVQARDGLAGALAAHMAYGSGSGIAGDREVYQRFLGRGVKPAFRAGGGGVLGNVPRPAADDERTLKWLRTQVAPSLRRLGNRGRGVDARRALAIDADG